MTRKIYMLFLTMSLIVTYSCTEEFLETAPTDAISDAAAFSSPENMKLVLNGLHRQMYSSELTGGGNRQGESYFMPALDFMSGEVIHTGPGFGWQKSEAGWRTHTNANFTTVFNFWFQRYHFIQTSNALINTIATEGFTETPDINNILGQAHAYRAWSYWRLVTTYAKGYLIGSPATDPGVPLLLEQGAPFEGGPRATVEEVYTQIEADIDLAISYLADGSNPGGGEAAKSHISLNAAYGIKARIALSKGDWAAAATNAALAREGFPLFNEADWHAGFNSVNLSEVIWGSRVIDTESNFFASYFYYISFNFNGGECRGNNKMIDNELYDAIPATDHRNKAWLPLAPNTNSAAYNGQGGSFELDPNYDDKASFDAAKAQIIADYNATSAHNTHPYMNVKFKQADGGTNSPDDVIYMRAAEMVLIEAEAKAMMNDITGAQDALDIIGSSRDTAFDKTAFATQGQLMSQIKFQRRVELWGEGFSFHDKIRWDEGIDHTNTGASFVIYQDGFMQERPSVNDEWIWKIPQQEIDSNPFLTEADQN